MRRLPDDVRQRLRAAADGTLTNKVQANDVPINEEITECSKLLAKLASASLSSNATAKVQLDWHYLPMLP